MDLFDAEIMAKELISQHAPIGYSFAFNRLKTINGLCEYSNRTIYLSKPLTKLRSVEAVKTTIMHEIAHALTPGSMHGAKWRLQMRKFGLPPSRCQSDEFDKSQISNWVIVCNTCGERTYFIRKPRVDRSCGICDPVGFNSKFLLTTHQL
jgi:SprT protein